MPALYTPILGLPYPVGPDPANVPKDIQALADKLDTTVQPASDSKFHQPGDLIVSAAATRAGCLICDGAPVSRATYAALFAAIGTAYGAGDGSATFNVPDLRARFPTGATLDSDRGQRGGEATHTLSPSEMPVHNHPLTDNGHSHGITDPTHDHGYGQGQHSHGNPYVGATQQEVVIWQSASQGSPFWVPGIGNTNTAQAAVTLQIYGHATGVTVNAGPAGLSLGAVGGGATHNNLPPYLYMNFFIKT